MERKGLVFVCFCVVFITLHSQSAAFPRDVVISSDENVRNVYDNSKDTEKQVVSESQDDDARDGLAVPQAQSTAQEQVIVKSDEDATKTNEDSTESGKDVELQTHVNDFEPKRRSFYVRVRCDFEEATEDIRCQEHCLPRGYSYGLCVQYTCSCI